MGGWPTQDLLQRADNTELLALSARQVRMPGLGAPVDATTGCIARPGQQGTHHGRIRTAGNRLDERP